ncbi:hypothetical protein AJ80_03631 [Polytolypa hystricis UAMH7299]|uniref:HPP transmembrane region domain-containing protein n=1 Tax=Polytolypa hystricis (strain UAMH7299) TaxID=1447883 RepID=A0A2B7YH65_POLH7|nr:hypothetical protein AJ80_03631 [Polytolypa hystricis UAMH7299]
MTAQLQNTSRLKPSPVTPRFGAKRREKRGNQFPSRQATALAAELALCGRIRGDAGVVPWLNPPNLSPAAEAACGEQSEARLLPTPQPTTPASILTFNSILNIPEFDSRPGGVLLVNKVGLHSGVTGAVPHHSAGFRILEYIDQPLTGWQLRYPLAKHPVHPNHKYTCQMGPSNIYDWEVDINKTLDPFVPYPRWHLIPRPIAHFLGYRSKQPRKAGNVLVAIWSFIGAFAGLVVVAAASTRIPSFKAHGGPIIGSFGAAAVLEYCAMESPLAQPRNLMFGHTMSAVIGVGISKLFQMSPHAESLHWIAGPLACAVATAVMTLTKTVHPPGGATALMASVSKEVRVLGWFLIPMIVLCCVLMLGVALILNNIQRRFPYYWWTAQDLRPKGLIEQDEEKQQQQQQQLQPPPSQVGTVPSESGYETGSTESFGSTLSGEQGVIIKRGQVTVAEGLLLTPEEMKLLEDLSNRL